MARLNRTCYACQSKYSYCPSCSRADATKPSWYSEFCSESCKDLWITLTKYNMAMLSKSDAKSIISELGLKSIDTYADCVKRDYAKVMAEDKKPKRGKRSELKLFDDFVGLVKTEQEKQVVTEQIIEEPTHEVVLEEKE